MSSIEEANFFACESKDQTVEVKDEHPLKSSLEGCRGIDPANMAVVS